MNRNENTPEKSCQNPITPTWLQKQRSPWATHLLPRDGKLLPNPRRLKKTSGIPRMTDTFRLNSVTKLSAAKASLLSWQLHWPVWIWSWFHGRKETKRWGLLSIQDKGVSGHKRSVEQRNFWNSQYSTIQGSKIPSGCRMTGRAVQVTFSHGWTKPVLGCLLLGDLPWLEVCNSILSASLFPSSSIRSWTFWNLQLLHCYTSVTFAHVFWDRWGVLP